MKIAIWNYPEIRNGISIPETRQFPELPDEIIQDKIMCPWCDSKRVHNTGERVLTSQPWMTYSCIDCDEIFEIQIREE